MTFTQIEKATSFLRKVKKINDYSSMEILKNELQGFYGEKYKIHLNIQKYNIPSMYSNIYLENDKATIRCFIEKILAESDEYAQIASILELIEEGKETIETKKGMPQFISNAYHAYSDKIKFDETILNVIRAPKEVLSLGYVKVDDGMINGIIIKLRTYAMSLLSANKETNQNFSLSLEANSILDLIFKNFDDASDKLKNRNKDKQKFLIENEYDVQDLMHAYLTLYFSDVRCEEWTPSYAGGSVRQDFILKNEKIVIETKMTREGLDDKKLGEELIIDIEKYMVHPDCKTLMFFVYDKIHKLKNHKAIKNDLEKSHQNVKIYFLR